MDITEEELMTVFSQRVVEKYHKIDNLIKFDDHVSEPMAHIEWMIACSNQCVTSALTAVLLDRDMSFDDRVKNIRISKDRIIDNLEKGFDQAEKKLWEKRGK